MDIAFAITLIQTELTRAVPAPIGELTPEQELRQSRVQQAMLVLYDYLSARAHERVHAPHQASFSLPPDQRPEVAASTCMKLLRGSIEKIPADVVNDKSSLAAYLGAALATTFIDEQRRAAPLISIGDAPLLTSPPDVEAIFDETDLQTETRERRVLLRSAVEKLVGVVLLMHKKLNEAELRASVDELWAMTVERSRTPESFYKEEILNAAGVGPTERETALRRIASRFQARWSRHRRALEKALPVLERADPEAAKLLQRAFELGFFRLRAMKESAVSSPTD